jgi:hypothetical protein
MILLEYQQMEEETKSCAEKLAFNTQKEAWTAATVARFQHGGTRLKAYKCKLCSLWHLASHYTEK